ncbi:MAG: phage tail protein [Sphingopyxis sp.]|uniref:phage tail protein n=1 Tax=Sphingopyxis sp. TaxID=1908224 RepID=UPI002ABB12AD|nr:phage tail protein [Sphingopyxis sp.]MDZ3830332.1 phage tail protein [Sphingopyxis sp.]
MATLVLTVVGGFLGGQAGAAIGAALGQQIDGAIFRPKGREGPRLADLKVQASNYGQQIPKLFGTMRVAGSVIWATDLIERRSKRGGGKGRPSVTEYSYSVSLAVALSSRRVRAVRRIWADGNLLRGASGTFRERCAFRLYDGHEDQPADPLIAAALGPASASAFRGLAYAVFEGLELASFGNRIPSLTFEVEADAGAVDAGDIGDALLGAAGRCIGHWPIAGYAASGGRVREALAPLFEADGIRLLSRADGWVLAPPGGAGAPVDLAAFREARRTEAPGDRAEQRRAPLSALPGAIRLRHYEPERDYQLGQQTSAVAGGGMREERIDLPAVLPAASARALARKLAGAAADGRETTVWHGDLAVLALPVGGLVRLGDGSAWRVAERKVQAEALRIMLCRYLPPPEGDLGADPGVAVPAPDWPDAVGTVHLFDIPNLEGSAPAVPRVLIAGAGSNDGWRGADCWFVPVADAEPVAIGTVRGAAAMGALAEPLGPGSAALFDRIHSAVVSLANPSMSLESVDDMQLLGGANRAMIGAEMIQFGAAVPVAPGRWRLSRLLRGRAGSDAGAGHGAGTPFVLLDDPALLPLPDGLAGWAEGGAARLQWAPRNATAMTEVDVPAAAAALRPLSPIHGSIQPDGSGGVLLRWIRRSRADTGWRDQVDLALGEAREAWLVGLEPAVAGIGPWECSAAELMIPAAVIAAVPPGTAIAVRQVGDFHLSQPLMLPLN